MELGIKIKNLRAVQKISQEELARMLQINRNYLSRIETGKSEPTSSILIDLARIFNISIDSLLNTKERKLTNEDKVNIITDKIKVLDSDDLDFIIRIIEVMREEFVKKKN